MKTTRFLTIVLCAVCVAALPVSAGGQDEARTEAPDAAMSTSTGEEIIAYPTLAEFEASTGRRISEFREAPMLQELVSRGELPPVAERLPTEPVVVQPLDGIGRYGGELRVSSLGPARGFDSNSVRVQQLLKFAHDMQTIQPNIATDWDLSDDFRTITIHLREGLKWSDGEDFDADDMLFWYEDIISNDELTPVKPAPFRVGGELMRMTKIDRYTVQADFAGPYPSIATVIALGDGGLWFAPKHYLSQFHIEYNAQANELARDKGYDDWIRAFEYHSTTGMQKTDPDAPEMNSWVLQETSTSQKVYTRNPYFWKVDAEGNQLPYIDRQLEIYYSDTEVLNLRVMAGDLSFANQDLSLANYPLYRRNQETGDYRAILMQQPLGSNLGFGFNPTHTDPVLRELFNDIRFKQAMSVAIDRNAINENFFFGQGVARQALLPSVDSLYEDWMGEHYVQYDPDLANRLLDEIGLGWDAQRRYRLRPDGRQLAFTLHATPIGVAPEAPILEMISEFWEAVGVRTDLQILERSLFLERGRANQHDVAVFQFGGNGNEVRMLTTRAVLYRPQWGVLNIGHPWLNWQNTGGASGEEPPQVIKDLFDAVDSWVMTVPGSPEYERYGKEILRIHVENLYYIGTIGEVPSPGVFKNGLRNTPKEGAQWIVTYNFASPHVPEQWYWH